MNCVLHVRPKGGLWEGACVSFKMEFSHDDYPIKAPKVVCISKLYHPNISLEGAVCLSMLKERHQNVNGQEDGWKPVNTLTTITFGVLALFMEPNPDDPLHIRAWRPPPSPSPPPPSAPLFPLPAASPSRRAPAHTQTPQRRCAKTLSCLRATCAHRCWGGG